MSEAVEKAIPKSQFLAILQEHRVANEETASINGVIGERIKNAVENANLHRGAYNFVRKLVKMDEIKRKDLLANVELYKDYCQEAGLFGHEHVGDLDQMSRAGDEPDADAERKAGEEQAEANAAALNKGIKKLDNVALADAFERGRIAFLNGDGGVTPADLTGKLADEWHRGWEAIQALSVEERIALKAEMPGEAGDEAPRETDSEFDDATSSNPSMPAEKKVSRARKAAAIGDAAGSYEVRH